MPFILNNAPSTFQALMNDFFFFNLRKFVLVVFDCILVFSKNLEDHLSHLRSVLEVLLHNQFYAKRPKCVFGYLEVEYMGHLIFGQGIRTDPKKTSAMKSWPTPNTVKALKGFLGLTGCYRKFIQQYGQIAAPLAALLKKNSFSQSDQAELAFQQLKSAVASPPVTALPDFTKQFVIECDASDHDFSAIWK